MSSSLSPNALLPIPSVYAGSIPSINDRDTQITDNDITEISLKILEKSLKEPQFQSETTTAIDLILKYTNQIDAITRQGNVTFEQINVLAEYLEELEENLKTQAFNNFLGLCDLLNTETPLFEVADIIRLLANISELKPATLKDALTKNLAGIIDLLQAGFSFTGIPLHHLLELKKATRQEILEKYSQIIALLSANIPFELILELFPSGILPDPN